MTASSLESAFRRASPRLNPVSITPLGGAIMTAIAIFWITAFVLALRAQGLWAWSMGVAFIAYDFAHLSFIGVEARKLFRAAPPAAAAGPAPSVGVIVAAYNEAATLGPTLDALLAQGRPPEQILVADDGSDDDTALVLAQRFGMSAPPAVGEAAQSPVAPTLHWLRLPHRGKARTLNAALDRIETEIVVTVDADTKLAPDAIAEIAKAFAAEPALVVGGGVLEPRCRPGGLGAASQTFQRFEYIRNFLARFAWSELDALLLISGAFAAFRTEAVRDVGGFDPECLVEDYELIHRLHRAARRRGAPAKARIIGRAFGSTDAPATLPAFLRQRRRWFAGFLQTQYWNRDMIGDPRYGALGMAMLPFKCLDAAAPLYGLAAFALLLALVVTGRFDALAPVTGLALAKLSFDLANMAYSVEAYRRWTGARAPRRLALSWACLLIEPFTFQLLRHLGAAWGWATFIRGRMDWGRASRPAAQGRTAKNSSTPSL